MGNDAVIHDVERGVFSTKSVTCRIGRLPRLTRGTVSARDQNAVVPVSTSASVSFDVAAEAYDRFMGRYSALLVRRRSPTSPASGPASGRSTSAADRAR